MYKIFQRNFSKIPKNSFKINNKSKIDKIKNKESDKNDWKKYDIKNKTESEKKIIVDQWIKDMGLNKDLFKKN